MSGDSPISPGLSSALGGNRTPNLLIRNQMLYPLSYERWLNPNNRSRFGFTA